MLKTGDRLGNFEIVRPLAAGGMGVVYLGRHHMLQTKVAIKVLLPNLAMKETVRTRFAQEAFVQSQLSHPGIVDVIDFIHEGDLMAFVMELVEGPTLHHLIEEEHPEVWQPNEALTVLRGPLLAVAYAHRREVVHRDLKPANILLERNEESGWPGIGKVTDFGLVKVLADESGMTVAGTRMGTIPYMSPEQFTGSPDIDARADVYALGIILHRMLAGQVAHPPDDLVQAAQVYTGQQEIPRVEGLPPDLAAALRSAISVDPAERPAHAGELAALLGITASPTDLATPSHSSLTPPAALDQAKTEALDPPPPSQTPPRSEESTPTGLSGRQVSVMMMAVGICALVAAVFVGSSDTDQAASKARLAEQVSPQTIAQAQSKVKAAWQALDPYKRNKSEHKKNSPLPDRASSEAQEADRLNSTPQTREVLALATIAVSRWALKDTSWNATTFEHDRKIIDRSAADGTPVGIAAKAILLAHACGTSDHRHACAKVRSAVVAAEGVMPTQPAWLAGELAWAKTRYWSRKAIVHIGEGNKQAERQAWSKVFDVCRAQDVNKLTAFAVGPLIMNECVWAAGRYKMAREWLTWMRWYLARDYQEHGKFLPWVVQYAARSSQRTCNKMRTQKNRHSRLRHPVTENQSDALCAAYGLVALGCLQQASAVVRDFSLADDRYSQMQELSRASRALPSSQPCYLDGSVQPVGWFSL